MKGHELPAEVATRVRLVRLESVVCILVGSRCNEDEQKVETP